MLHFNIHIQLYFVLYIFLCLKICKFKRCERYRIMEDVRTSSPEIYENQLRYVRQKNSKIKWIGEPKESRGSKYYTGAEVNGEVLESGDFAFVRPDDQKTPYFICRIIYFEHDGSEKIAHIQTYCRGGDTLLGETADPKEVFALIDCESVPCYEIMRKIDVWYWQGPHNWKNVGGSKRSTYTPSDEIEDQSTYWFRRMYNPALGRFEVVPPLLLEVKQESGSLGDCSICKFLDAKEKYNHPMVTTVSINGIKQDRIVFRNVQYKVGDAVFLTSSGVIEQKANVFANPKSKVDSNIYTEYYRKFIKINESVKGSLADFPKPFEIGIIREIINGIRNINLL